VDFVGVDLHKQVIKLCLVRIVRGKRKIIARRQFGCRHTEEIREYFEGLRRFEVVVEATASYEWSFLLIEDLAARLVLAHPRKLRVIAESITQDRQDRRGGTGGVSGLGHDPAGLSSLATIRHVPLPQPKHLKPHNYHLTNPFP
jgi:hypothetical protein